MDLRLLYFNHDYRNIGHQFTCVFLVLILCGTSCRRNTGACFSLLTGQNLVVNVYTVHHIDVCSQVTSLTAEVRRVHHLIEETRGKGAYQERDSQRTVNHLQVSRVPPGQSSILRSVWNIQVSLAPPGLSSSPRLLLHLQICLQPQIILAPPGPSSRPTTVFSGQFAISRSVLLHQNAEKEYKLDWHWGPGRGQPHWDQPPYHMLQKQKTRNLSWWHIWIWEWGFPISPSMLIWSHEI